MPALSRRAFAQLLGASAAAATLPFPAFAAKRSAAAGAAKGPVRLSANENPFKTCPPKK